ncbi:MAG: hypothetical protein AAF153_03210, partial [Pseudomonadota bacterium]
KKHHNDFYTWLDTELGELKVAGNLPNEEEWCLQFVEIESNTQTVNLFNQEQKLLELLDNWQLWEQLISQEKLHNLVSYDGDNFNFISQMLLTVLRFSANGYSGLINNLKGDLNQEDPDILALMAQGKIIDNYHSFFDHLLWLIPVKAYDNNIKWLKIWRTNLRNEDQEQYWQIEWQFKYCGNIQISISTNCQLPSIENMTQLNVDFYAEQPFEFNHEELIRNDFDQLCRSYQLWGDITFLSEPKPLISTLVKETFSKRQEFNA